MKIHKIEITDTELDFITLALSLLKQKIIDDKSGVLDRKMPNHNNKENFLSAVSATAERFNKMAFNGDE